MTSRSGRPRLRARVAIDVDDQLRVVGAEAAEEPGDAAPTALPRPTSAAVAVGQSGDVAAGLVEHLELEAAEHRQPLNRRRRKRHDDRAGMPNIGPRTRLSTAASDWSGPRRSS